MVLDSRLNLIAASQPSNLIQSLMSGFKAGEAIRQAPLMESLMEQQLADRQQAVQLEQQKQALAQQKLLQQGEQFSQGRELDRARLEQQQQELGLKKDTLALKREELQAKLAEDPNRELKFSDLRGVAGDISKILGEPQKIKNAASRLSKISKTKSPTDQLAAIFTFMKSLDPTSVVREGEQDQARATGGLSDQFIGYVNKLKGEGSLPEDVFNEMVMTAKRLANQAIDDAGIEVDSFIDPLSDDLPDLFIQKTRARVPVKFKDSSQQQAPNNDPLGIR